MEGSNRERISSDEKIKSLKFYMIAMLKEILGG